VDGSGNVVTSTHPTAGTPTWTVTDVDGTTGLLGASCPSSDLWVAVDWNGNVVTGANSASLQDVPSTEQYPLHGSDGTAWQAMDVTVQSR
jgi:hypothetical protein